MGNTSGYDEWLVRVEFDRKSSGQHPALELRASNPIVQVIKPYDLKMGTRGQIFIKVFRGEYLSSSTVPELLRVLFDGQDITEYLSITKVWTKSTTGSSDLETFLVQGRPSGSLAPGVHVLEVNAESVGYRGGSNPGRTRLVKTLLVEAGREEETIRGWER